MEGHEIERLPVQEKNGDIARQDYFRCMKLMPLPNYAQYGFNY